MTGPHTLAAHGGRAAVRRSRAGGTGGTGRGRGPRAPRLVGAELMKLATGRWQLAGLCVVLAVHALPLLLWGAQADPARAWISLRARSGFLLAYAMMFFGLVLVTSEYRYRTVTHAWLVSPGRVRVLAAQATTVVLTGMVLSSLVFAAWWLRGAGRHGGAAMRSDRPAQLLSAYLIVVAVVCAAGLTGVALGELTRGLGLGAGTVALSGLVEAVLDGARFHGPVTAPSGVLLWPTTETPVSSLSAAISWAVVLIAAASASLRRDLPS
ncbi:ABC transporter permease [Parafrankia elaeagni]|uniref:ABC transporter permease n=1 Tax=Parafrankia elaeagni TaxID=222534 RepID=UPI00036E7CCB|nr:ABC transporter permease [Parafrankia elaeagni]